MPLEAIGHLRAVGTVAGYLPIRSEIDPRPAMLALTGLGYRVRAGGRGTAAGRWRSGPGSPGGDDRARARSASRCRSAAEPVEPDVLLVPMLAFDARGHRLGYGGGFYDRTIAGLRARREVHALGFAYAAQEVDVGAGQRDRHAARRDRDRGGGPLAGAAGR